MNTIQIITLIAVSFILLLIIPIAILLSQAYTQEPEYSDREDNKQDSDRLVGNLTNEIKERINKTNTY